MASQAANSSNKVAIWFKFSPSKTRTISSSIIISKSSCEHVRASWRASHCLSSGRHFITSARSCRRRWSSWALMAAGESLESSGMLHGPKSVFPESVVRLLSRINLKRTKRTRKSMPASAFNMICKNNQVVHDKYRKRTT